MRITRKLVSEDVGVKAVSGVIVEPPVFMETLDRHETALVKQIILKLDRSGVIWLDTGEILKTRPDLSRQNLWRARRSLEARGFFRQARRRTCFQVNPWLFHRSDVFRDSLKQQRAIWDALMADRVDQFDDVDLEAE